MRTAPLADVAAILARGFLRLAETSRGAAVFALSAKGTP